jgi:acetyl-CoA carboxylase biotin carboxyl carrier protein
MMDLSKLREILKIVAESEVAEVEIEEDDFKVVVRKTAPTMMVQAPMPAYHMAPPMQMMPHQAQPAPQQFQQAPQAAPVAAPSESPGPAEPEEEGTVVRAPIVGTFYRRPSPDDAPYVDVGDSISVGQVLCIIEAMKLMNEIESEVSGTILKVLVEDGQPVEYDQPLFVVKSA